MHIGIKLSSQHRLLKRLIFLIEFSWHHYWKSTDINISLFLDSLSASIDLYAYLYASTNLGYCYFVVSFKTETCESNNFFKDCLTILSPLHFPMNFGSDCQSLQKGNWSCIKPVDHSVKYCRLNIKYSYPWTGGVFPFI